MGFYLKGSLIVMKIYNQQFKNGEFVFSTREHIDSKQWDATSKMPKVKKENDALRSRLLELDKEATDYILINRRSLTSQALREHLEGLSPKEKVEEPVMLERVSIVKEWRDFVKMKEGNNLAERTLWGYEWSVDNLEEFMAKEKLLAMMPGHFNLKVFMKFKAWLHTKYSPNSVAKVLKYFREFIKYLRKSTTVAIDPDDMQFTEGKGLQLKLDDEKLEKWKTHKLKKSDGEVEMSNGDRIMLSVETLEEVRWLYYLQCYTGSRVSDVFRLADNLKGRIFDYETQKVKKKRIQQPMLPQAKEALEFFNYKLPDMSEKTYREGIKCVYRAIWPDETIEIRNKNNRFKRVPVWEEISSHDAVRTFVTLLEDKGVAPSDISLMVGKSQATIIKHYITPDLKKAQKNFLEKMSA